MIKLKTKNLFLSIVTSGSKLSSKPLNLAITDLDDKENFYCEFENNFAELSKDPFCREVISHQMFNNVECYKTFNSNTNSLFIKDHDNVLLNEMKNYLEKISENGLYDIQFWIDNPLDWGYFLNKFFIFQGELPIIPEFIIPSPIDLNSIIQYSINRNNGKSIQDLIPLPDHYMYMSLIKSKYNKEITKILTNM